MFIKYKKLLTTNSSKAFTLVELIVVMTITTALSAVLIVQQGRWNDQLAVDTQAYELVLMIRQAQVYAMGVKGNPSITGDKFNLGYGVHIDLNGPYHYVFYADLNNDRKYIQGEDEIIEQRALTRGVSISKICGIRQGAEHCEFPAITQISVGYRRPTATSTIVFLNNGNQLVDQYYPPAKVYLVSPNGREVFVRVDSNGIISTQ
jgi:type II secretory pathway pseudopilin PulG